MVVAAGLYLPVRVAGGGAQGCSGTPVLAPLARAADSGRVADALPAVALGSSAIGCACRWRICAAAWRRDRVRAACCSCLCTVHTSLIRF